LLLCCALALSFAGCSGSSTPEPEDDIRELPTGTGDATDGGEEDLFRTAKRQYGTGMFNLARDSFDNLKTNYPVSPYAEFAEIKLADSHFESRQFDAAATLYEQFIKDRPASAAAPYALMRTARSSELSYGGLGRDTAPLDKALQYYDRVIKEYPQSVQADAARAYRLQVLENQRAHEQLVAQFYEKRGREVAAKARQEVAQVRWSPLVEEATSTNRARLERSQLTSVSLLPSSLPMAALSPVVFDVARGSKLGRRSAREVYAQGVATTNRTYRIQRSECRADGGTRRVTLFLNKPFDDQQFLATNATMQPTERGVRLELPDTAATGGVSDCFASGDLTISTDGEVQLTGEKSTGSLLTLRTPPRMLLVFQE
jgi:outer membrane protein assembly factor BamD